MSILIHNVDDLKVEISRLKSLEHEQAGALRVRFSSPAAIMHTAMTLFPKSATADGIKSAGLFNQDFLSLISRIALPLTLNKTLFKHSNFLVKTLVGIVSQKASNYISEDSAKSVWEKAKGLFSKFNRKKEDKSDKEIIPAYAKYYKEGDALNHQGEPGEYSS